MFVLKMDLSMVFFFFVFVFMLALPQTLTIGQISANVLGWSGCPKKLTFVSVHIKM